MAINLADIKTSKITQDLGAMNVLIYGQPKVGKTTLAAQIPNALFLATEPGHRFVEVKKQDIASWQDVLDVGAALAQQKHDFKTLVIDIADYYHKFCEKYVMEKNQVEHPSDLAFGKGFSMVKDELTRVTLKMNAIGMGLVFISHAKEKAMKTKTGEWTQMGTSMTGSAENIIAGLCDIILYCHVRDDGSRVMRTKPTKYILAGDRSKTLPELMPMDYKLLIDYLSGKKKADVNLNKMSVDPKQEVNKPKEATV